MILLSKRLYLLVTLVLLTPTLSWGGTLTAEPSHIEVEETGSLTEAELDQRCNAQTAAIEALESPARAIRAERRENYAMLTKAMIRRALDRFPKARFPRLVTLWNKLWYRGANPDQPEFYTVQTLDKHDARALQIPCHCATVTKLLTRENVGLVTVPLIDGNDSNNLYALCQNKEELSAVVAHEAAHLYRDHVFKRILFCSIGLRALSAALNKRISANRNRFFLYVHTKEDPKERARLLHNRQIYEIFILMGVILLPATLFFSYARANEREADKLSLNSDPAHAPAMAATFTRLELAHLLWEEFIEQQPRNLMENVSHKTGQVLGKVFKVVTKLLQTYPSHTERIRTFLAAWRHNYAAQLVEQEAIDTATAQQQAEEYVRDAYTALVDTLTLRTPEEVRDVMMSTFRLAITRRMTLQKPFVFSDETVALLNQKMGTEFRDKLLALATA